MTVLTPSQIAQALNVRPPTVTKSIARLVEQGFIARASGHADGRIVQVQLTEAGNNILNDAAKAVRKADKQALKALDDREAKQLRVLVEKLSDALAKRDSKALKQAAKKDDNS
ncbi:MAG: MarR family transcriptional regulator [Ahrensia sp.]|nr:MarR family transcriptional regulator [Ahrensia sp.]